MNKMVKQVTLGGYPYIYMLMCHLRCIYVPVNSCKSDYVSDYPGDHHDHHSIDIALGSQLFLTDV